MKTYTVTYYSNWHGPIVKNANSMEEALELKRLGKDQQYLVDIEEADDEDNAHNDNKMARVFEDVGGYYICDDSLDYLDARGCAYASKAAALRAAKENGYTHARGSGTYKKNKLTKL